MNIIEQNPFRVLGLLGNSTEKELQKQIGTIKAFARVGKSKTFDYDFDLIGNLSRTTENVQLAACKIEQAQKKLHYSLFWFIKNSQFDEIALNNVKNQNTDKAIEIWEKTLKEEVSNKNFSSYLNLSTLYLALSEINKQLEIQKLHKAIELKGRLIYSDCIDDFSSLVIGKGLLIDKTEICRKFVDEILETLKPYLDKSNGISTKELISLFKTFPPKIQKYLSGKFTEVPISNIENNIDKTTTKRKDSPQDADNYGEQLHKKTKADITLLKKLLGINNIQYQMIVNKLANEILQCTIEYFNYHRDKNLDFDPGDDALRVAKYAKSLDVSGQIKNRIDENTAIIQKWVDDNPARKKIEKVKDVLNNIDNNIEKLTELVEQSRTSGESLYNMGLGRNWKFFDVSHNRTKLDKLTTLLKVLKSQYEILTLRLSSSDELVKDRGNYIVLISQNILVAIFNSSFNSYNASAYKTEENLRALHHIVQAVRSMIVSLNTFYMESETKQHYNRNLSTIKQQEQSIKNALPSNFECYIATMAYGDYEHPQVKFLRQFRDEKLAITKAGRQFIRFYYATSPHLVKALKNNKQVNRAIRSFLDKLIKHIK
jgi:predicted  nucleic acid-binding Zn-ribbon protein